MARPLKHTTEKIVAALKETKGLIFLAAKRAGCDPDTIYRRAKVSAKVAAAIKSERGEFVDMAELKLQQAVLGGESWAVALVLKTLGKDRGYVERTEHADVSDIDAAVTRELERLARLREASALGASAPEDRGGHNGAASH